MSTFSKETIETAHVKDSADSRPTPPAQPLSGQLHSDAVSLEVPLKVHGTRTIDGSRGAAAQTEPFEEQTSSMIVFPHGGVVRMSTPLATGQMLVLTNQKTRQDAICRVVKVRTYSNSASYVEVEFTHRQSGFWGVYFEGDAPASAPASAADPLAPAASAPLPAAAVRPRSPSSSASPSASFDSNFAALGSQEAVQPAASSTGAPAPGSLTSGIAKSSRPAPNPKSVESSIAPVSLAKPLGGTAPTSASLRDARAKLATPSTSAAPLKLSALPAATHEQSAAAAPFSGEIVHQAAGETFGARLGSDTLIEVGDSAGNKNWMLIAACALALVVIAAGGFFFLSHKSGDKPEVAAQPVSQAVPPVPASTAPAPRPTMPSSNVTVTPSTLKPATVLESRETSAASVAKATKEPPVVKESYSSTEPASQAAAAPSTSPAASSEKTSVPSVFGTLNAHPVAPSRNVTAAAPNVDVGVASGPVPNALAGITSPAGGASSLPEPVVNSNLPLPVGGRVKEPQLITRVLPTYPPLARQAHTQGDVVVQVIVDKSGNVIEGKAISGPAILRQAAVDAVRRWKYEAPTLDGQPIVVQMLVTLRFQL